MLTNYDEFYTVQKKKGGEPDRCLMLHTQGDFLGEALRKH